MELFQYYERDTWLHSANALTKILFVTIFSFIIFISWDIINLVIILILLILIFVSIKPSYAIIYPYVKISIYFTLMAMLSQSLFYYDYYYTGRGRILFYIIPPNFPILNLITQGKGVAFVLDGLMYGLIVSIKAIEFLLVSLLLVLTTKPGDILRAFLRLKFPLKLAVASMIALRFVPLLIEEIILTTKLLSEKGEKFSIFRIHRYLYLILKNVTINAYKRAFSIGVALKLRGINGGMKIPITGGRFNRSDLLIIFIILSLLIGFSLDYFHKIFLFLMITILSIPFT